MENNCNRENWLYIPMETKVREMDSKLLLACFAAESGFTVVTGNRKKVDLCLSYMPKGIYYAKGANQGDIQLFNKVITSGHKIVAQDEEGVGFLRVNDQIIVNRILSESAFKLIEKFFAWGNVDSKIIKSILSNVDDKIVITGSPRIDLLRPEFLPIYEDEAKKIKERFGPFILINTNFSECNNFNGCSNIVKSHFDYYKRLGKIYDFDSELLGSNLLEFENEIINYFKEMISHLSVNFPDYTLVVRPHPGENIQFWEDWTGNLSNVQVIHKGSVIPWIMAANVLIHNKCTTGIESFFMNRTPTMAYCPIEYDTFDMYLPNDLSYKVFNLNDLNKTLNSILEIKNNSNLFVEQTKKSIAHDHVASFEGMFACERIVIELGNICMLDENENKIERFSEYLKKKYYFLKNRYCHDEIIDEYSNKKFSGLELGEVMGCINRIQKISGRFGSIKLEKIDTDLYQISLER